MTVLKTAILGASGYTGADLIRLAVTHPRLEITALVAERRAGMRAADVWPHLQGRDLPDFVRLEEADLDPKRVDVLFCCLPHATSQAIIKAHIDQHGGYNAWSKTGQVIIDLSADFRIRDPQTYATWYGGEHQAPDLQAHATYGLTEHYADALVDASLIACPGCYPTAALLGLLPLVKAKLIALDDIIIDAKSGVTGAGRGAKEAMLFAEVAEAIHPYGVGSHRHMPEIEQEIAKAGGRAADDVRISFTPHLMPMNRGELETIYVRPLEADADQVRATLAEAYQCAAFVSVLEPGRVAATRMVRGSNGAVISVHQDRIPSRVIVTVAIDNLVKGSSGQAIQNMNRRFGFDEQTGLEAVALFP